MRDITTQDLIDRLILHTHKLSRFEAILLLDRTARNAGNVKAAKANQAKAIRALNRYFDNCVKEHERQVDELSRTSPMPAHLYTPTRKGLKKVKR